MIIFHQRQIIAREERIKLLNRIINNLNFNIADLQEFRTRTLDYIDYLTNEDTTLTEQQKEEKIDQLNWRISLIDFNIQETTYLLNRVSNKLNNIKSFTKTTPGIPVNRTSFNSSIYNIHHRFDLKFPTFAPNYPIRIQQ
jgi:hypothetical protein